MRKKYSLHGFEFGLGVDAMVGIYTQVKAAAASAKTEDVKSSLSKIIAMLLELKTTLKYISTQAEQEVVDETIKSIKKYYKTLLSTSEGQQGSADKATGAAAVKIFKLMKRLGVIFSGNAENQWGAVQRGLAPLEDVTDEEWTLLNLKVTYDALKSTLEEREASFANLVKAKRLKKEKSTTGPILEKMEAETRTLGKFINAVQAKDDDNQNEDDLVVDLDVVWTKARTDQDNTTAANAKKKAAKKAAEEAKKKGTQTEDDGN